MTRIILKNCDKINLVSIWIQNNLNLASLNYRKNRLNYLSCVYIVVFFKITPVTSVEAELFSLFNAFKYLSFFLFNGLAYIFFFFRRPCARLTVGHVILFQMMWILFFRWFSVDVWVEREMESQFKNFGRLQWRYLFP